MVRDKKYRQWISEQPCVACGRIATDDMPNIPAHQRDIGDGGMGLKPGDNWLLPLCNDCHHEEHRGNKSFWNARHWINRYQRIINLITRYYIEGLT